MLKKLLASALAVATVASCAYVPSALASAATVEYHTADVVKYMDWKLNTPDAPSTNVDVNIYVNTNVTGANGVYTLNVAPEKNNEADVKAALNDAKKDGTKLKDAIGEIKETEAAVKYVVEYFYPAGTNTYVAQVAKKRAVVFSTWDANLTSHAGSQITDVKAKTLSDKDVQLLGYYNDGDQGAALAEISQTKYTSQVRLAHYAFKYWVYTAASATDRVAVVSPFFDAVVDPNGTNYSVVNIYKAANIANGFNGGALVAGTYYNIGGDTHPYAEYAVSGLLVPNYDKANWTTYLGNYLKLAADDTKTFNTKVDGTGDSVSYTSTKTVRQVADKTYAVTYKQDGAAANNVVTYTLNLRNVVDGTAIAGFAARKGYTSYDVANWTTDPAEMYAIIKGDVVAGSYNYVDYAGNGYVAKDTLANYLVQGKDAHTVIYELTDKYASISVDKYTNHTVTVDVYVTPKEEYTVYSYAANDTMKETQVYLSAAEAANDGKYNNQDGTTQIVDKKVTKATAEQLGVATAATVKGVPAEYAYAQTDTTNKIINCTYKTGASIGVELADFQTATGEFQTEPYFGRDAKVGDQVTLKVSLSDAGVAKKLDLTKVTVEFAAAGVATVSENFDYAATEFPAGVATTLTLAQGTNIVTATVYYDGAKVGTFAPFYAYVG